MTRWLVTGDLGVAAEGATATVGVGGTGTDAPLCPAMEFGGMFWGLCWGGAMVGREGCCPTVAVCVPVEEDLGSVIDNSSLKCITCRLQSVKTLRIKQLRECGAATQRYLDKAVVPEP